MPRIVIANSLATGFVEFLTETHDWSLRIADAAVADSDEAAEALLAAARAAEQADRVIDPNLIDVTLAESGPEPVEYREYIRAFGPSVRIPS